LTNDGVRVYLWDEQDRLIQVRNLQTSDVLVQNRYDGLSRRRERVQLEGGAMVTNRYVYDGWLVVAVLDGENDVIEQYVHGVDLSGTREGAGGIGGILADFRPPTSDLHFYHYDGNGNVSSVTDSNSAITARYEYDPFGRVLLADGGDYTPRYQFSSKEYDQATGLNYYGYRFYSPELGRWVNRDPIEEVGGLHLYAFVFNAPTVVIDPDGRNPAAIAGILSAAFGGISSLITLHFPACQNHEDCSNCKSCCGSVQAWASGFASASMVAGKVSCAFLPPWWWLECFAAVDLGYAGAIAAIHSSAEQCRDACDSNSDCPCS
jgi:RHS repeat-associated protein